MDSLTISNTESRDRVFSAISNAKIGTRTGQIGSRPTRSLSRDMAKPANLANVFVMGGQKEIHASKTEGLFKGWVWVYENGVLTHAAFDPQICETVIALEKDVRR